MRVGIVGRGRVGGAFARTLANAGDEIVLQRGRGDARELLAPCDVVILAVPDGALDEVAADVLPQLREDALLIHSSAARDLAMLEPHGDRIGMLHPPIPIASPERSLTGITFGAIGTPASRGDLEALAARLGGSVLWIEASDRVRYHAALVHASNHLVALAADAATLLGADAALLLPLLRITLDNLEQHGPEDALTGPVVRGDDATVAAHLAAIPAELRSAYRANAFRALALAQRSGRLDRARADAVAAVLREDAG